LLLHVFSLYSTCCDIQYKESAAPNALGVCERQTFTGLMYSKVKQFVGENAIYYFIEGGGEQRQNTPFLLRQNPKLISLVILENA
jgi:hypothetical protein